jgi:hypothetical protein
MGNLLALEHSHFALVSCPAKAGHPVIVDAGMTIGVNQFDFRGYWIIRFRG